MFRPEELAGVIQLRSIVTMRRRSHLCGLILLPLAQCGIAHGAPKPAPAAVVDLIGTLSSQNLMDHARVAALLGIPEKPDRRDFLQDAGPANFIRYIERQDYAPIPGLRVDVYFVNYAVQPGLTKADPPGAPNQAFVQLKMRDGLCVTRRDVEAGLGSGQPPPEFARFGPGGLAWDLNPTTRLLAFFGENLDECSGYFTIWQTPVSAH